MMLNEAQINEAAREYCRLMGQNPDEHIQGGSSDYSTLSVVQARWRFFVDSVRREAAMLAAIRSVQPKVTEDNLAPALEHSQTEEA